MTTAGHANQYTEYGRDTNRTSSLVRRVKRANPHYLSTTKERIAARFYIGSENMDILESCGLGDDTFAPEILARIKEIEREQQGYVGIPKQ